MGFINCSYSVGVSDYVLCLHHILLPTILYKGKKKIITTLKISVTFLFHLHEHTHFPHPSLRLVWDWKGLLSRLRPRLQLSSQHRDGIRWTGPEHRTHTHIKHHLLVQSHNEATIQSTTEVRIQCFPLVISCLIGYGFSLNHNLPQVCPGPR